MIKKNILFATMFLFVVLQSCRQKELIEVQVPLPEEIKENEKIIKAEDLKADEGAFKMVKLPYNCNTFIPDIEQSTFELHYAKIYLDYTNNLNKQIKGSSLEDNSIEEIISQIDVNNLKLTNNACGFYNHTLFFESLIKSRTNPSGLLLEAINTEFGSLNVLKSTFNKISRSEFGSGWTWLIVNKANKLEIINTQNEDNPLLPTALVKGKPILCLDLWEHAYISKNQMNRANYIETFLNHINWDLISKRYEATQPQL
jgi:superoxide dismutase, Fe-Mn family